MMNKNKEITSRDEDFAKWYTDVVSKAGLTDYSGVKGFMILQPYGYSIWENIQRKLDAIFKDLGHQNVYMPMLIPESLLKKESEHIEGFAPEVAWVTQGGENKLEERLCIRPTSETLFCEHYSKIIKSYRDLPKLYNQWCNIVRWEKETRPFLRTREILWQEGHTAHATAEEAEAETLQMLNVYKNFFEDVLAIPVITGKKTEKEKFAGAEYTYTVEAMMYNGVILQSATSHYFGQKFSKPFNVTFLNKENKLENVYQSSWGVTTRAIGALIMVHGDDNGLILPPRIAPTQAVIIPIGRDEAVLSRAEKLQNELKRYGIAASVDASEKSPGFRFAEHEMRGVPLRIELGPKDLAAGVVVAARRDTGEKITLKDDDKLAAEAEKLLCAIQQNLYTRAQARMTEKTRVAKSLEEMKQIIDNGAGFIKAMWCGDRECEDKIKEDYAIKSRCIPFEQEEVDDKCVCCGKKAKKTVIWGIQY